MLLFVGQGAVGCNITTAYISYSIEQQLIRRLLGGSPRRMKTFDDNSV